MDGLKNASRIIITHECDLQTHLLKQTQHWTGGLPRQWAAPRQCQWCTQSLVPKPAQELSRWGSDLVRWARD